MPEATLLPARPAARMLPCAASAARGEDSAQRVAALRELIYQAPGGLDGWDAVLKALGAGETYAHARLLLCSRRGTASPMQCESWRCDLQPRGSAVAEPAYEALLEELDRAPRETCVAFQLAQASSLWRRIDRSVAAALPSSGLHVDGLCIDLASGITAYLLLVRVADAAATADDGACWGALIPDLKCALELHDRLVGLERHRDALAFAIDELHVGWLTLDGKAELVSMNRSAREQLSRGGDLALVDRRLVCTEASGQSKLVAAIRQMLDAAARAARSGTPVKESRSIGLPRCSLFVQALPGSISGAGPAQPVLSVLLRSIENRPAGSQARIEKLFGLTRVEAAIAAELAHGATVDGTARGLGISRNTVRTHLRAVFAKLGVGRQTKLVSVLLASIADIGD